MSAPQSIQFAATDAILRAFEKYAHDKEFNDFITALQDRAVTLAIMALGQRDDVIQRWMSGRGAELLEMVAAFNERKVLRESGDQDYGYSSENDPLRGLDL